MAGGACVLISIDRCVCGSVSMVRKCVCMMFMCCNGRCRYDVVSVLGKM